MSSGARKWIAGGLAAVAACVWIWVFTGDHGMNEDLITGERAAFDESASRRRPR